MLAKRDFMSYITLTKRDYSLLGNMDMYRKVEDKLAKWKQNPQKKALLVTGARQIGKTYIVREFGKSHYKNFIEINFITTPDAKKIFDGNLEADTIIMNLTAFINKPLEPHKTLIFLDEIQMCSNARTAIKFLVDDGRFDYIESGSLLGVQYKIVPSYPVGYEEILQMYPLDFEEFCLANGVQSATLEYLQKCYDNREKITDSIHQTMSDLFKYYVIVGGMPAVVQAFINTHDIGQVTSIQRDIIAQYRQDISQYAVDKKTKISSILDNIPSQLADKNRRFHLSSINSKARLREYEDSFMWLQDAGVALSCYNITEPKVPLKINENRRLFKLFMNDCGLLCAMGLENVQFDILQGNMSVNMGSVLENVFAELLKSNGFALRYMDRRNVGKVDFVVQQASQIVPIEIKSGKDYKSHAALNNLLAVKDWGIKQGIVFCMGNIEAEANIVYLPWYMVMFFKQVSLDNLKVYPDLSGLKIK